LAQQGRLDALVKFQSEEKGVAPLFTAAALAILLDNQEGAHAQVGKLIDAELT
jgi:hypothetical protein